jgi:uncharacterized membrane protein YpjA
MVKCSWVGLLGACCAGIAVLFVLLAFNLVVTIPVLTWAVSILGCLGYGLWFVGVRCCSMTVSDKWFGTDKLIHAMMSAILLGIVGVLIHLFGVPLIAAIIYAIPVVVVVGNLREIRYIQQGGKFSFRRYAANLLGIIFFLAIL